VGQLERENWRALSRPLNSKSGFDTGERWWALSLRVSYHCRKRSYEGEETRGRRIGEDKGGIGEYPGCTPGKGRKGETVNILASINAHCTSCPAHFGFTMAGRVGPLFECTATVTVQTELRRVFQCSRSIVSLRLFRFRGSFRSLRQAVQTEREAGESVSVLSIRFPTLPSTKYYSPSVLHRTVGSREEVWSINGSSRDIK